MGLLNFQSPLEKESGTLRAVAATVLDPFSDGLAVIPMEALTNVR